MLNVTTSNPKATVAGETKAEMLGNLVAATGGTPRQRYGQRQRKQHRHRRVGGGWRRHHLGEDTSNVDAEVRSTILAAVGGSIDSAGNVTVLATSRSDADTVASSASGGVVDVSVLNASSQSVPTVTADIAADADIDAGGTVTVTAEHGTPFVPLSDGSFAGDTAIDTVSDTITLADKHGLVTGDTVTYQRNNNTALGGLSSGRNYNAIVTGDSTLKLGTTFNTGGASAAVNVARDTISFPTPHNLQTGDTVVYRAGSPAVGGLTDGGRYTVQSSMPQPSS